MRVRDETNRVKVRRALGRNYENEREEEERKHKENEVLRTGEEIQRGGGGSGRVGEEDDEGVPDAQMPVIVQFSPVTVFFEVNEQLAEERTDPIPETL